MFDYASLVPEVRRAINDPVVNHIDIKEETTNDSYYILLNNDGYATPVPSGVVINGIPLSDGAYTVTKNVIKVSTLIPAGSEVFVQYDMVTYEDSTIEAYIGDTIHNVIEPIFNIDFGFGDAPEGETPDESVTYSNPDNDLRALFVSGTALSIFGVQLVEAGGDAIYIKDGDTIIDTAKSSTEKARGHDAMVSRWNELLKRVQINRFSGATQY